MSNELAQVAPSAMPALIRPIASPEALIEAHKEGVALVNRVLESGVDYGVIPGTGDKPTLLKPGAERLLTAFGTYADPIIIETEVDHDRPVEYSLTKWEFAKTKPSKEDADRMKAEGVGRWKKTNNGFVWQTRNDEKGTSIGFYRYVVKCNIVHRQTGAVIASGVGSCSSMESKYIRSPRDYENTILKMAKKRAMIDATLNAFGLSERFTQDVEDLAHVDEPRERPKDGARLEAETFLKNLFGDMDDEAKKEISGLKQLVRTRGGNFLELVREAMDAGATTRQQLRSYIEDGTLVASEGAPVNDAPATDAPDVAAQAPLGIRDDVPAPVALTTDDDEYDPFADVEKTGPEVETVEAELVDA